MTIDSISPGTATVAGATRQSAENRQLVEARLAERQEAQAKEPIRRDDEVPQPVVNAQGQPTGTLINVVA